PFPNVADHLPKAKGAVPFGQSADIRAAEPFAVQVGAPRRRRIVAPGEPALAFRQRAAAIRTAGGRHFPFRLGRQPAPCEAAKRLRLVPVDVDARSVRLEGLPAVELAPLPASLSTSPVQRVLGPRRFAPTPTLIAPPGAPAVTSRGDEVGELA